VADVGRGIWDSGRGGVEAPIGAGLSKNGLIATRRTARSHANSPTNPGDAVCPAGYCIAVNHVNP
jgi:hypothetical protein